MQNRTTIKVAGESGMGIESAGMIIMKALKQLGFYIYGEREFPSLIKGGRANIQINFSKNKVRSLSDVIDIGLGLDREGVLECLDTVKEGGILIHGFERWNKVIKDLPTRAEARNLKVIQLPAREIALENGGNIVMVNVVLLGFLWQVLGLDITSLKSQIALQFAKKPELLQVNYACAEGGYNFKSDILIEPVVQQSVVTQLDTAEKLLIDGNSSIVLGGVHAGTRAYYAYPMSPSSTVLVYMSKIAKKYGILVKQAEDEITVAQLTLGSMHAGTRAFCATSGGGLDLMTETISLSAMVETPLVIVNAQRPGPATGLPTWTGQADLNMAIYSAHGEFPRVVIACSDPESCFENVQHALNYAEKFQIPVILLTEANIAMGYTTVKPFQQNTIAIERGLTTDSNELESIAQSDRYKITDTGVSKRWLPGSSKSVYFANGDEHWEGGELNEDSDKAKLMIDKRNAKTAQIVKELPEPEVFGTEIADISFVGWGSTKNTILDALDILKEHGLSANYFHYNFVWPLKTEKFVEFFKANKKIILAEGNLQGQLGSLLEGQTGLKFHQKLLKYNGRPFTIEDILEQAK
ncbi:MAG: 2-oxoacid:acceptor oxidoreductase subunit alpha [bacterium]